MKIYSLDMSTCRAEIDAEYASLPRRKRRELDSVHPHRRIEMLAGYLLISRAAVDCGVTIRYIRRSKYGKPYAVCNGDFYFNISHSGNIIYLVCDKKPVGVDVEQIDAAHLKLLRKVATESERAFVESASDEITQSLRFCIIWTLKEAYMKAEGKGMHIAFDSISFNVRKHGDRYCVTSNRPRWDFTVFVKDKFVLSTAERRE